MATKRPNTIGSNPLKASTAKSLQIDQGGQTAATSAEQVFKQAVAAPKPKRVRATKSERVRTTKPEPQAESAEHDLSKQVSVTPEITPASTLPKQSPGTAPRVRRSVKETEALFAEQLKPHESEDQIAEAQSIAAKASEPVKLGNSAQEVFMSDRHREAMIIVKTWSQWSVVAGMTPVPILDTIVLSGTQIKLIQLLCKHYNVPFEHKVALAVATGLIGSTATVTIAGGITRSLVRNVPVLGQIFNWTVEPALSFGSTYAIGATFVRHFEADGNLLSFKGEQMKAYAAEQYKKGKNMFLSKKHAAAA